MEKEKEIYQLIYNHALQSKRLVTLPTITPSSAMARIRKDGLEKEEEEEEIRKRIAKAVLEECRDLLHSTALQV